MTSKQTPHESRGKRPRVRSAEGILEKHVPKEEYALTPEQARHARAGEYHDKEVLAFVKSIYPNMSLLPSDEDIKNMTVIEGPQGEIESIMNSTVVVPHSPTFFTVKEPDVVGFSTTKLIVKNMPLDKILKNARKGEQRTNEFGGLKLMKRFYTDAKTHQTFKDFRNHGVYLFPGVYIFQENTWYIPAVVQEEGGVRITTYSRRSDGVSFGLSECGVVFHL